MELPEEAPVLKLAPEEPEITKVENRTEEYKPT